MLCVLIRTKYVIMSKDMLCALIGTVCVMFSKDMLCVLRIKHVMLSKYIVCVFL